MFLYQISIYQYDEWVCSGYADITHYITEKCYNDDGNYIYLVDQNSNSGNITYYSDQKCVEEGESDDFVSDKCYCNFQNCEKYVWDA